MRGTDRIITLPFSSKHSREVVGIGTSVWLRVAARNTRKGFYREDPRSETSSIVTSQRPDNKRKSHNEGENALSLRSCNSMNSRPIALLSEPIFALSLGV